MENNIMYELGKDRATQIRSSEICTGALIGIFTLWVVWAASTLLIHIIR